jgi:HK97 family phage major capsid protein
MTPQCVVEVRRLQCQVQDLLARGTPRDIAKATELRKAYEAIQLRGTSTDEVRMLYAEGLLAETSPKSKEAVESRYRVLFDKYVAGIIQESELRGFLAGTEPITYTQLAGGGGTIPFSYDPTVFEAFEQTDQVLSASITGFVMTPTPTLQPQQVSGYDLSTISASLVGEAVQQVAGAIPAIAGSTLKNDLIFKSTMAASIEALEDIPDFAGKVVKAGAVALARRIGISVLTGSGSGDILGVTKILPQSYSNATQGKLTLADFNSIYFSVDRWYRSQAKCGWLMPDAVYKYVRAAVDNNGRPLLNVEGDTETLLGKPIYISPSLARSYSSLGIAGVCLFGDLSHLIVRMSRPTFVLSYESAEVDITSGQAAYIFRARADATLFDPSSGVNPPIVMAIVS